MQRMNRLQFQCSYAKMMLLFGFVVGMLFLNIANAEKAVTVYRWQHPDGSVEFSDESRLGSEPVVVEEPMIISPEGAKKSNRGSVVEKLSYTSLSIKSPTAEATFRNQEALSIVVVGQIEPSLKRGDQLLLLLDGQIHAEPGRSTRFTLPALARGAHTLQLAVQSADKDRVMQSDVITIYVQRNIARPKAGG